ncbi:hypothetical protein WCE02_18525 [Pseudomonas juntendi]|uniref:hypothetical protein n=1 Tax=Pseudomonas juntendi TaxID=2666183 RepID=UPI0034D469C4
MKKTAFLRCLQRKKVFILEENMWKSLGLLVSGSVLLSGCWFWPKPTPESPGEMYGWRSLEPPRENALGRQLFAGGKIGDPVINIMQSDIEVSSSSGVVSSDSNSKLNSNLEVFVKGVSAELGYDYEMSKKVSSSDWRIQQIKNFAYYLPVEQRFIYQCLVASEYKFDMSSKSGGKAVVDASVLAKSFGVDKASVGVTSAPTSPDKLSVTINNPNICLSYVSAYFKDVSSNLIGSGVDGKYVDITGQNGSDKYSPVFNLMPGQKSWFRAPQYSGKESPHKPWYRIAATLNATGQSELEICVQYRSGRMEYKCKLLDPESNGVWDRPYHVDTYPFGRDLYKVISVNVSAKRMDDNSIRVEYARLMYPEYKLIIK